MVGRLRVRPWPRTSLLENFVLAGVICGWLLFGVEGREIPTEISSEHRPLEKFKHVEEKEVGQGELTPRPTSDLNYMSKRKVPNGPDPIHNRRAGNSRQPPGLVRP